MLVLWGIGNRTASVFLSSMQVSLANLKNMVRPLEWNNFRAKIATLKQQFATHKPGTQGLVLQVRGSWC